MHLRFITPEDDRTALSRIYEASWKHFYKGIVPSSFLDSIPEGFWASKIDEPGRNTVLAFRDEPENENPVGICSFGKSRSADFPDWNEIYSIYVLPGYTGRGYGKALFRLALAELTKTESAGIYLWVFKENYSARQFYEKHSFIATEEFSSVTLTGTAVPEIKYVYKKQEDLEE